MKKIIFFLFVSFFCNYSFAGSAIIPPNVKATCAAGDPKTAICSEANNNCGQYIANKPNQFIRPGILHPSYGYLCSTNMSCPQGFNLSQGECKPLTCTAPKIVNIVVNAGIPTASCIDPQNGQTQSSSSSSSSAASCPVGQVKDAFESCNTKCASPYVYNPVSDSCQFPANCTYPEVRNSITNTCSKNEEKCAIGASVDVLTGYSCKAGIGNIPTCPSGWNITPTNQCEPAPASSAASGTSTPSSSGAASSTPSGAASSAPSGASSSVPRLTPPTSEGDNTSPTQSTDGSKYIPPSMSNSDCLAANSALACTAYQNCQLTFGVANCVGMTSGQSCPNQYTINGQKLCVLSTAGANSSAGSGSGSGSGSNTSSAGECDPTAKSYDECMGRLDTPTDTQTQVIIDKTNTAAADALKDYTDVMEADINEFKSNGITFKSAVDTIYSPIYGLFPQAQSCQPLTISFKILGTVTLQCKWFDLFKAVFGWALSVLTAIYVYHLAIRPVER